MSSPHVAVEYLTCASLRVGDLCKPWDRLHAQVHKCGARCLTFLVPLSTANMLFDVRNVAKNISIRFIFSYSSFGVLLSEVEDANQLGCA